MKRKIKTKTKVITPDSAIRNALRRLWLWSPERTSAIKRDAYKCQECGKKKSKVKGKEVKLEIDHDESINWDEIFKALRKVLFCRHYALRTLCSECHRKKTNKQRKK